MIMIVKNKLFSSYNTIGFHFASLDEFLHRERIHFSIITQCFNVLMKDVTVVTPRVQPLCSRKFRTRRHH